jgi:hypothetical protein
MVGMAGQYRSGPVNLLKQDDLRERVRQRQ